MWFWKRSSPRAEPPTSPPSVWEALADLRAEVRGLRREVDDLDESLRSFKGRVSKRGDQPEASEPAAPAGGAAPSRRPDRAGGPTLVRDLIAIRRGPRQFPGQGG